MPSFTRARSRSGVLATFRSRSSSDGGRWGSFTGGVVGESARTTKLVVISSQLVVGAHERLGGQLLGITAIPPKRPCALDSNRELGRLHSPIEHVALRDGREALQSRDLAISAVRALWRRPIVGRRIGCMVPEAVRR